MNRGFVAITALFLLFGSASASASNVAGTMCYSQNQVRMQTFVCPDISGGEELTIAQIYQRGYRVVSAYRVPEFRRMPEIIRLIVEKQ